MKNACTCCSASSIALIENDLLEAYQSSLLGWRNHHVSFYPLSLYIERRRSLSNLWLLRRGIQEDELQEQTGADIDIES